jgi:hypothetical protein
MLNGLECSSTPPQDCEWVSGEEWRLDRLGDWAGDMGIREMPEALDDGLFSFFPPCCGGFFFSGLH